jgi:hypothetical protein
MTYVNHRVTEITENAQSFLGLMGCTPGAGVHPAAAHAILRASSVCSVSPWLAYVITRGAQA